MHCTVPRRQGCNAWVFGDVCLCVCDCVCMAPTGGVTVTRDGTMPTPACSSLSSGQTQYWPGTGCTFHCLCLAAAAHMPRAHSHGFKLHKVLARYIPCICCLEAIDASHCTCKFCLFDCGLQAIAAIHMPRANPRYNVTTRYCCQATVRYCRQVVARYCRQP